MAEETSEVSNFEDDNKTTRSQRHCLPIYGFKQNKNDKPLKVLSKKKNIFCENNIEDPPVFSNNDNNDKGNFINISK